MRALLISLALYATGASADAVCTETSVLTLLGTDTAADRSLFALSGRPDAEQAWVVLLDHGQESAQLLRASLPGLRAGASHGAGTFLSTIRCGEGCFQPLRWAEINWDRLGAPIQEESGATLHMTWDRSGAPWVLFHHLGEQPGVTDVAAYRWDGELWIASGRLRVQAVGSPAATADPTHDDAVLSGSGRFRAGVSAGYWLPALPRTDGGQVIALTGAAAFLTHDSHLLMSIDGGSTWLPDSWNPWRGQSGRGASLRAGHDFSIDRPTASVLDDLPVLWYDERPAEPPSLHLARWTVSAGWQPGPRLDLGGPDTPAIDHVLMSDEGRWTLLGACRSSAGETYLEAGVVDPGAGAIRQARITLVATD